MQSDIPIVYGPPPSGGIVIGSIPLDDGSADDDTDATFQPVTGATK